MSWLFISKAETIVGGYGVPQRKSLCFFFWENVSPRFLSVSKYGRKEEQLIKTMNFNSLTISARVTVLPNVFIVSNPPVAPIAFMIKPSVSPSIWTSASFLMGDNIDSNSWNSQQLWNSHFTWVVAEINVFSFVSFFFFTISVPVEIILLNLYSIQR